VDTVAALIGELLEYRAGGASHLEVAAGKSHTVRVFAVFAFNEVPQFLIRLDH